MNQVNIGKFISNEKKIKYDTRTISKEVKGK